MTVAALYIDPKGPYPRIAAGAEWDGSAWSHEGKAGNGPRLALDCYDATRDARLYAGPHPVVAHPPCKHWGRLRRLAHVKCRACGFNGPDRGAALVEGPPRCPVCGSIAGYISDRDCAPRAVEQVRAYGGVLEHPAESKLWEACGLRAAVPHELFRTADADDWAGPLVGRCYDVHGGYTLELDQCEWGHVARKRTWLYLVDVPREALEAPPFPGREPTHWCSGRRTPFTGKTKGAPPGLAPPGIKFCSEQQRRRTPPLVAEYLVRLARAAAKERAA